METRTVWSVYFPSDLAVVGYNPENADLDRPRGEIIRERFSVVAEDALGHRRLLGSGFESEAAAEAAYLEAPPVALWEAIRPCYGSEAYAADAPYWEAQMDAWERDLEGVAR